MHRRFNHTQRNYIIVGLCAILVLMGVGYAAFASQLRISGTSNISGDFSVKIISITPSDIKGNAADKSEVTTYTDTTATFGTSLELPGDSITYNIVIENQGNIDAVLKTINKTDAASSAILFETSGVNEGDTLLHGKRATMKVKVTYNPNVTTQPESLESTLKVDLTYEQSDSSIAGPGPGESTTTVGGQEVELVDSGAGLYVDEYEAGKYTYKGANPNNHITFNGETWRILSVESDGSLKIMKNESIGNMAFDITGGTYGSNNWDRPADLNTYLNGEYLNSIKTKTPNDYAKIVPHTWSIGAVTSDNSDLADQISSENGTLSQPASVGMITVSEYLRANTNTEQCGNMNINNTNHATCITTNWMQSIVPSSGYLWTISPSTTSSNNVFYVYGDSSVAGIVYDYGADYMYGASPSPVLYLSPDITLTGDGTQGNPFTIS